MRATSEKSRAMFARVTLVTGRADSGRIPVRVSVLIDVFPHAGFRPAPPLCGCASVWRQRSMCGVGTDHDSLPLCFNFIGFVLLYKKHVTFVLDDHLSCPPNVTRPYEKAFSKSDGVRRRCIYVCVFVRVSPLLHLYKKRKKKKTIVELF